MADAHLERIEQKLDALTDHVVALDTRVGGVEQGVAGLDRRMKRVDERLTHVENGLTQVNGHLTEIGETMAAGFKRLEVKVDSLAETQTHINGELSDRVRKLEDAKGVALEK